MIGARTHGSPEDVSTPSVCLQSGLFDGLDLEQALFEVGLAAVTVGQRAERSCTAPASSGRVTPFRCAAVEYRRRLSVLGVRIGRRRPIGGQILLDLAQRRRLAVDRNGQDEVDRFLAFGVEGDLVTARRQTRDLPREVVAVLLGPEPAPAAVERASGSWRRGSRLRRDRRPRRGCR